MKEYRAISLHQPWASLVALGIKKYETRSWSTNCCFDKSRQRKAHDWVNRNVFSFRTKIEMEMKEDE